MAEYTSAAHYGPGDLFTPRGRDAYFVILGSVTGRGWCGGKRPLSLIGVHVLQLRIKLLIITKQRDNDRGTGTAKNKKTIISNIKNIFSLKIIFFPKKIFY